jgi:hypothetical protein
MTARAGNSENVLEIRHEAQAGGAWVCSLLIAHLAPPFKWGFDRY